MALIDLTPAAGGYAQILRAAGRTLLLSVHLDGPSPSKGSARIYFAIVEGDRMLFASADAQTAAQKFDEQPHEDSPADVAARPAAQLEDFLEWQPTTLPTVRGEAFRLLAAQLPDYLQTEESPTPLRSSL